MTNHSGHVGLSLLEWVNSWSQINTLPLDCNTLILNRIAMATNLCLSEDLLFIFNSPPPQPQLNMCSWFVQISVSTSLAAPSQQETLLSSSVNIQPFEQGPPPISELKKIWTSRKFEPIGCLDIKDVWTSRNFNLHFLKARRVWIYRPPLHLPYWSKRKANKGRHYQSWKDFAFYLSKLVFIHL